VAVSLGSDTGRDRMVWYGGGRLARDLTLPSLRRAWQQDAAGQRRALSEWNPWTGSQPRSDAERQAELEQRALMWHRCTAEIERVREQLRAAGVDPAACAHAAREAAGVLAAWSMAREAGPLARAARQLARSGELHAHANQPPARPAARASGLALFILAAGKPDSTFGWLLVCRELALLARELGRAHQLRGELQRAPEIEATLGGEIEAVRSTLESQHSESAAPLDPNAATA